MKDRDIIKRTAIHQDTINGLTDPMPWPTRMWAERGDELWTACIAQGSGADRTGLAYEPGDIIVHKHLIDHDRTRIAASFQIIPDNDDPLREMLDEIRKWDGDRGDVERAGMVEQPRRIRLTIPGTDTPPAMGWQEALARAEDTATELDPELLRASLMDDALCRLDEPCVFYLEDNGYDLIAFEWHMNADGDYDSYRFSHLQYDADDRRIDLIGHSDGPVRFGPRRMDDGELLTHSDALRDQYQRLRERDGGPDAAGITGRPAKSGILRADRHPLLDVGGGVRAPEWSRWVEDTALGILNGGQRAKETPAKYPSTHRKDGTTERWPNVWISNAAAHPYTMKARNGREWDKMIIVLPAGTVIDGRDVGEWRIDRFMSDANKRQKTEGRAVNIRFRPGEAVELFQGRGADRRSFTVDDPEKIRDAVRTAQRTSRAATKTTPEHPEASRRNRTATTAKDDGEAGRTNPAAVKTGHETTMREETPNLFGRFKTRLRLNRAADDSRNDPGRNRTRGKGTR